MEDKLCYPIKYAVLELKKKGGWAVNYEDIIVGFIVSKCYVVGQSVKYFVNGTKKITYDVVFPYKDIDEFTLRLSREWEFCEQESIPQYSYYGNCTNANVVSDVFDTYEDALEVADKENINLRRNMVSFTLGEKLEPEIEAFQKNLVICKEYERIISEKTEEMIVTNDDITLKTLLKS